MPRSRGKLMTATRARKTAAVRRLEELLARPTPGIWALALALTLAAMLFPLLPTHTDPGPAMDEGLLLVEPERVLEGELPNRDFESFYGPTNTYLLAGVYAIGEPGVVIERGIGILYRLAVIAGVFALASFAGPVAAVAAGLVSGALLFVTGPAAFAYFGGLACAIFGLFLLARAATRIGTRGRLYVLAGIAGGLAISYRPQFGFALLLGAVPLLLGHPAATVRRFVLGAALGALPLVVHTVVAGPGAVFENLVVDAFFRSAPQSTRPFPPELASETRLMVLTGIAIVALAACAAILWRRSPRGPDARRVAAIALFSAGLAPQALGRVGALHLIEVACVAVPLLAYALAAVAGNRWMAPARSLVPAAATAVLVAVLAWSYVEPIRPAYGRALQLPPWAEDVGADVRDVERGSRSFPLSTGQEAEEAAATLAVIDELTDPGDRLVVGSDDLIRTFYNDTYLYHLLPELEPGTYYLTMAPGTANGDDSRLPEEVAAAEVVVLGTLPSYEQLLPNSELGSTEATEVLARHFCLRESLFVHLIYERCR
jgi:hypothetical protein